MSKDKNIVLLDGIIGDDAKFDKTSDGKEYFTFRLCINLFEKEYADATERTHGQTFARIFVNDPKLIEYLRRVDVKRGQRASVFGRISSCRNEYKGISYIANNVVCRDIEIIKAKE